MSKRKNPYQKGDRVVTSGGGRTAKWPGVEIGTVTLVFGNSVEVHFDGIAFGHQMYLDEIAPAPDFYHARWTAPQAWYLGVAGGRPIYADCADCGAPDAIIHGCLKDKWGDTALVLLPGGVTAPPGGPLGKPAVFCEACFARRLAEAFDPTPVVSRRAYFGPPTSVELPKTGKD
jgi:hypothetical protein